MILAILFAFTTLPYFLIIPEISHSDISGISTKAPCEAALIGERHVRIEISDFVMRTFVLISEMLLQNFHHSTALRRETT